MTRALRWLDTGLDAPRRNVSFSAALAELHATGASPDTLRLHGYALSVLLGRGEPLSAIDQDFCAANGIALARRLTGGRAVLMSPAMLAWEIVLPRTTGGGDLASAMRRALDGVGAAVQELGVSARFAAPGSLTVGGRKIAGAGGYHAAGTLLVQGTLLIADETAMIAGALGVGRVRLARDLTCLAEVTGRTPAPARVSELVARGLAAAFARDLVPGTVTAAEATAAARMYDETFGRDDFVAHGDLD